MKACAHCFSSRFGPVLAVADDHGRLTHLYRVRSQPEAELRGIASRTGTEIGWSVVPTLSAVEEQLGEYLEGGRREFDLELAPHGTAFYQEVWERMCRIPYGSTVTYSQIANDLGRPSAVRAVGQASARNPIWIVIPCHRVVGSSGKLTGYGGGLPMKRDLLAMEAERAGKQLGIERSLFSLA